MTKPNKSVRARLRDTDFNRAQSNIYRRLSANLYKAREPENSYYHIHGSLEASSVLESLGLPAFKEEFTDADYPEILKYIGDAVGKHSIEELESLNNGLKAAGIMALKPADFLATPHGTTVSAQPYWMLKTLETETPPVPFPAAVEGTERPQVLTGIKVLELCRIIAGPTVTRILAEYGAEVLKITAPNAPDVPFFQVDGNVGKHTAELDLKSPEGRRQFEELLADADVVVDGFRPHAIEKLGYGPEALAELGRKRGKGYVYVNENCFGYDGEWEHRAGWQQIADCVSGLAWCQGVAMGRDEPIIPPFPMSDYGYVFPSDLVRVIVNDLSRTGCMGAIAALSGIYERATKGGSYWGQASLVQYDLLLLRLQPYPKEVWQTLLASQDESFKTVRYNDSVDRIGQSALIALRKNAPWYWDEEESKYLEEKEAPGFGGKIKIVRPAVRLGGTWNGFIETSRPNGYDKPEWWRK